MTNTVIVIMSYYIITRLTASTLFVIIPQIPISKETKVNYVH